MKTQKKNYYKLSGNFKNVSKRSQLKKQEKEVNQALKEITEFVKVTQDHQGEWKTLDENKNFTIFDDGKIWSHKRCKFLKTANHQLGYLFAGGKWIIDGSEKKRMVTLHRLVARNFLPNPNNYEEINHKDGNKKNNHVTNLEWCSRKMNMQHSWDSGMMENVRDATRNQKGENSAVSKLSEKEVLFIKNNPNMKGNDLAKLVGISPSTISSIRRERTWEHLKVA